MMVPHKSEGPGGAGPKAENQKTDDAIVAPTAGADKPVKTLDDLAAVGVQVGAT
jgi:hypothetical protein